MRKYLITGYIACLCTMMSFAVECLYGQLANNPASNVQDINKLVLPVRSFSYQYSNTEQTERGDTVIHSNVRQVLFMLFVGDRDCWDYSCVFKKGKIVEDNIWVKGLHSSDFHLRVDGKSMAVQYFREQLWNGGYIKENTISFTRTFAGEWGRTYDRKLYLQSHYVVGFVPPASGVGSCHTLTVESEGGNYVTLLNPRVYCYTDGSNPLFGTSRGNAMSRAALEGKLNDIPISIKTYTYYDNAYVPKVQIVVGIAREKVSQPMMIMNEHYKVEMYVYGIVSGGKKETHFSDATSGEGASRYIDVAPMMYATEMSLSAGRYKLMVAINDTKKTGTSSIDIDVAPYDGKSINVSSIIASQYIRGVDAFEFDYPDSYFIKPAPFISNGMQIIPAARRECDRAKPLYVYFEIYDPRLLDKEKALDAWYELKVINKENRNVEIDTGKTSADKYVSKGNMVVPVLLRLNIGKLGAGCYDISTQAYKSNGEQTRTVSDTICITK